MLRAWSWSVRLTVLGIPFPVLAECCGGLTSRYCSKQQAHLIKTESRFIIDYFNKYPLLGITPSARRERPRQGTIEPRRVERLTLRHLDAVALIW